MSAAQIRWIKIAESLREFNLNAEGLMELDVDGKVLCIARHGDRIMACANKCPHAGGYLSEGYVDALGNIVCPLHRYKFSLETGRNVTGEGYFPKDLPGRIAPGRDLYGIKEKSWLGW